MMDGKRGYAEPGFYPDQDQTAQWGLCDGKMIRGFTRYDLPQLELPVGFGFQVDRYDVIIAALAADDLPKHTLGDRKIGAQGIMPSENQPECLRQNSFIQNAFKEIRKADVIGALAVKSSLHHVYPVLFG